jgi:hypothetical protein
MSTANFKEQNEKCREHPSPPEIDPEKAGGYNRIMGYEAL